MATRSAALPSLLRSADMANTILASGYHWLCGMALPFESIHVYQYAIDVKR
jgi:hypothetical protein